jgi:pimeloyl-ACP methyl ester carboxylesterase
MFTRPNNGGMNAAVKTTRAPGVGPAGMVRTGVGEPLLLLHGVLGSSTMWSRVTPLLGGYHDVIALTALGHRGGPAASTGPVLIRHVVDDVERALDRLQLEKTHVAGNSMGGWIALELARRGRALSVCALSPAGLWEPGAEPRAAVKLERIVALTRWTRWLLPCLAWSSTFRRIALRDNATQSAHVDRTDMLAIADDALQCTIRRDLFASPEYCEPLRADCPVTVAWAEFDRIFPVVQYLPVARKRFPNARCVVMEGVGHVPMFDDPAAVAVMILSTVRTAQAQAFAPQPPYA